MRYRASERQACRCRVVGQHRSTQRHVGKIVNIEESKLRHRLREIAAEQIRWGVNHKSVQRLWREEGLQRPTPRKRKRARRADGSVRRHRAEHPHHVWAMSSQRWLSDDHLIGGEGADRFEFSTGHDVIRDFNLIKSNLIEVADPGLVRFSSSSLGVMLSLEGSSESLLLESVSSEDLIDYDIFV